MTDSTPDWRTQGVRVIRTKEGEKLVEHFKVGPVGEPAIDGDFHWMETSVLM